MHLGKGDWVCVKLACKLVNLRLGLLKRLGSEVWVGTCLQTGSRQHGLWALGSGSGTHICSLMLKGPWVT